MTTAMVTDERVLRGAGFGLFARLLGPDPAALGGGSDLGALRAALERLGDDAALDALGALPDGPIVADGWSRLFEQGRVSPYEMSYLRPGLGGHTARLADVSGFYHAFGFRVTGDRPDHLVAMLEFAAYLLLGEADAMARDDETGAEIYADGSAKFLADHLGGWIDLLADQAAEVDGAGVYGPLALGARRFVDAEAARRGVEVDRLERVDRAALSPPPADDGDEPPTCAGCPAFED